MTGYAAGWWSRRLSLLRHHHPSQSLRDLHHLGGQGRAQVQTMKNGGHPDGSASTSSGRTSAVQVLLYVPQLISYVRIALLLGAEAMLWGNAPQRQPQLALLLYLANFALDAADGMAARRLNQATAFGAFLDVALDNLTRAALWSRALPGLLGVLVPALESLCFVCAHKAGGKAWKEGCFQDAPPWVRVVVAKNFRTAAGAAAMLGLFGLPMWLWALRMLPGHPLLHPGIGVLLLGARALSAAVELWLLRRYLAALIKSDA